MTPFWLAVDMHTELRIDEIPLYSGANGTSQSILSSPFFFQRIEYRSPEFFGGPDIRYGWTGISASIFDLAFDNRMQNLAAYFIVRHLSISPSQCQGAACARYARGGLLKRLR
jgi:hypothetical protein